MPTLQVSGEIDLSTVPMLHDALRRLIADHLAQTVVIDLDGISVLDDAGLGVLLGAAGRAREQGGDLVIVCTSRTVAAPLRPLRPVARIEVACPHHALTSRSGHAR